MRDANPSRFIEPVDWQPVLLNCVGVLSCVTSVMGGWNWRPKMENVCSDLFSCWEIFASEDPSVALQIRFYGVSHKWDSCFLKFLNSLTHASLELWIIQVQQNFTASQTWRQFLCFCRNSTFIFLPFKFIFSFNLQFIEHQNSKNGSVYVTINMHGCSQTTFCMEFVLKRTNK